MFGHAIYRVSNVSMNPLLRHGDLILVDTHAYSHSSPERGDVVIAINSHAKDDHHVKRVVGLPSETILITDGQIYINGLHLKEPYLNGLPAHVGLYEYNLTLEANEILLLGDNRAHSASLYYNPVETSRIIGRLRLRLGLPRGTSKLF